MKELKLIVMLLLLQQVSSFYIGLDVKPKIFLMTHLFVSHLLNSAEALSGDIIKVARDIAKTEKGETLYEMLSGLVSEMKSLIEKKENYPPELLQSIMLVKDRFKEIQEAKGDLSEELLEKFRDKVIEAFHLVTMSSEMAGLNVKEIITNKLEEVRRRQEEL